MSAESRLARVAGLLYLVVVVTGIFSLGYVPSRLVVHGDVQATLERMAASEMLLRYGIASFVVEQVAFLLLAFALFRWAVIFEGIAARARAGNASADNAAETGRLAAAFARRAAELTR